MEIKYAFIMAYTDNYLPGITALTNSIRRIMPNAEIIVHHGNSVEDTAIKRFEIALNVSKDYDSICLMDVDMFLTHDCTLFFEIASRGFIVTGSNGMIIDFDKAYQDQYGLDLGCDHFIYPKVHTTAPIFISKADTDWFDALYSSRRIDRWDDFLYLNMLGIKMGKHNKMICMPPYTFTGIHHWMLKPATAVFERNDILLSGTEEQVYMVHGKWWDDAWLQDLMPTMERYLHDEGIGPKGKRIVEDSISLLKRKFSEALNG